MLNFLGGFLNSGVAKSVENVAKEWIETEKDKAEASTLMLKTLDPNGLMRRDISQTVRNLYVLYIIIMLILVVCQSFGLGNQEGVEKAINSLTDLFVPTTTMFTAIVGASFGVNGINSFKGK